MANGTLAASQLEMLTLSGTGVITIVPPNTNTNRTLTLPDSTGTVATNEAIAAAGYTTSAGVLTQFNATGSAPVYACRAWVNFNGTGTVAIRASGNVSSITDNGTGDYTVNFTTAMPDANYAVQLSGTDLGAINDGYGVNGTPTTSSVRVVFAANGSAYDMSKSYVSIFR